MDIFTRADILLPNKQVEALWPVVACDQFTAQREYWVKARTLRQDRPSALHLILPEAELGEGDVAEKAAACQRAMTAYLEEGVLRNFPQCYIYIERTLTSGAVRPGLIGAMDLEQYHPDPAYGTAIRATEALVEERIPPRLLVRRGAEMELPHILMLCDDFDKMLIEPLTAEKDRLPLLYDFDLPENGGHLTGWRVSGEAADRFDGRLSQYAARMGEKYPGSNFLFAVGDGNHSMVTAKRHYEAVKQDSARYVLVELENLHHPSQVFEPVHRVILKTDPEKLLRDLSTCCAKDGYPVEWVSGKKRGTVYLNRELGALDTAVLQPFLDDWLEKNPGEIDYIHEGTAAEELGQQENAIALLLSPMDKGALFPGVLAGGMLPRKTFSMGHAWEKRYYMEGRRIR